VGFPDEGSKIGKLAPASLARNFLATPFSWFRFAECDHEITA